LKQAAASARCSSFFHGLLSLKRHLNDIKLTRPNFRMALELFDFVGLHFGRAKLKKLKDLPMTHLKSCYARAV
jgi:hypothetical protein